MRVTLSVLIVTFDDPTHSYVYLIKCNRNSSLNCYFPLLMGMPYCYFLPFPHRAVTLIHTNRDNNRDLLLTNQLLL